MDTPTSLLRLVVVEDSAPVRERVLRALLAAGPIVCVGEAASVADAIASIDQLDPDALVLDMHLIGGTGLDVLRAVKPTHPKMRVAVLTSFANDQYRAACLRAGADCVFDKINDFVAFLAEVQRWALEQRGMAASNGPTESNNVKAQSH